MSNERVTVAISNSNYSEFDVCERFAGKLQFQTEYFYTMRSAFLILFEEIKNRIHSDACNEAQFFF